MIFRSDNRNPEQIRPINIIPDYIATAEGSALIEIGNTRVICTATIEEVVPQFLRRAGREVSLVMAGSHKIVEIQARAEQHPFDEAPLKKMMGCATTGSHTLIARQRGLLQKLPRRQ